MHSSGNTYNIVKITDVDIYIYMRFIRTQEVQYGTFFMERKE